jgi:cobalt-zinc-cadmium efflux system membrane fusion protein
MEVSIGKQENGFIEILNSEVFANKQIVFKGAYTLLMKMKNKEE